MLLLIIGRSFASGLPCDLWWVDPYETTLGVQISSLTVPTHSPLLPVEKKCPVDHTAFRVLALAPYFLDLLNVPQIDQELCFPNTSVSKVESAYWYAHDTSETIGLSKGASVFYASNTAICWSHPTVRQNLSLLSESQMVVTEELQRNWSTLFQVDMSGRVWVNPWGYVSLPHRIKGPEEMVIEYKKEHLTTPKQREKSIRAVGPNDLWFHFWGSDPPMSDAWAPKERIIEWVALAHGWKQHCTNENLGTESQCILKIGDIAWLNAHLPDPLGHQYHFKGNCMDIRLFRTDESSYEAYWNKADDRGGYGVPYNRDLTQDFVQFVQNGYSVERFYFNDPSISGVLPSKGHDDHLHLCLQ